MNNIKDSKNTLTQKILGNRDDAICKLDLSKMSDGQRSGLVCLSKISYSIGVEHKDNKLDAFFEGKDGVVRNLLKGSRFNLNSVGISSIKKNSLSYSLDNKRYDLIGDFFTMERSYWKGTKIDLYNYNVIKDGGIADFDFLHYHHN